MVPFAYIPAFRTLVLISIFPVFKITKIPENLKMQFDRQAQSNGENQSTQYLKLLAEHHFLQDAIFYENRKNMTLF